MTNCYNCGHTGTFVLLAQFAFAVPESESDRDPGAHAVCRPDDEDRHSDEDHRRSDNDDHRRSDNDDHRRSDHAVRHSNCADGGESSASNGVSLAVQCPACDSTDVGVGASDLLARYGASTTS